MKKILTKKNTLIISFKKYQNYLYLKFKKKKHFKTEINEKFLPTKYFDYHLKKYQILCFIERKQLLLFYF